MKILCPRCHKPAALFVTTGNSTVKVCETCAADIALDDEFRESNSKRRHAAIEKAGHNPRMFRTR